MAKLTKNQKIAAEAYDATKAYPLAEAVGLLKKITKVNFDPSVDIAVNLGVDPRKAEQMIRGTVVLPHGTGKDKRVLVLCTPDKEEEAKAAGADYVGLEDYIKKIEGGWKEFDVMITMPMIMAKVGKLGKVLGPRGLMPNPKTGTVTVEVGKAVTEIKKGKIDFKVDKYGILHASVGRASFTEDKLEENITQFMHTVFRLKPSSAKGTYVKNIAISSTMSGGIVVEKSSVEL